MDDCDEAFSNDLDMNPKNVIESMTSDIDMKPTGTAGRRERASRQAVKEAAREARHQERQVAKEKCRQETRELRGAFLTIFERIADKICGDKK